MYRTVSQPVLTSRPTLGLNQGETVKRFTQRRWRHAAGQSAASRQKLAGDSLRLQLQRRVSPAHAVPKRQPAVTGEVRQLQAAGRSVVKHAGRQQPNPQQGPRPATRGAAVLRQLGPRPAAADAAMHRRPEVRGEARQPLVTVRSAVIHAGRQQPNPQQGLRPATKGAAAHRQQGLSPAAAGAAVHRQQELSPAAAGAAVHRQQELSPEAADAAVELSQAVAVTAEAAGPLQRAAVHQGIQITAAAHREDKGHRAGLLSALIISPGAGKNNPAPFISLLSG